MIDENGKLKSFERFSNDVQPIADHNVKHWLRTEYDTAVLRAHNAADWRQFEEVRDILPNLRWMPTTSVTPDKGVDNNPRQDAQLFSDTHPYIKNAYKGAEKAVDDFISEKLLPLENFTKADAMFKTYKKYKSGGDVLIHELINKKASDYKDILTIAVNFAKQGETVKLTPVLYYKSEAYQEIYGALDGTKYERKCPDLKIGNYFYEYESFKPPFRLRKLSRMLSHGGRQSSRIIINNNKGASDTYLRRYIHSQIRQGAYFDEVWAYEKGKVRLLFKRTAP